ncbi:methanol utilization protein MoxY [Methylococcus geothermalis]|uniref:Oxygen sensor histidine kinase NreB n=2 Tax=Methylococcus geothermalis TaxID=2681310 RepID=A0A858QC16_9GAMM|nr:methanol utilization protein MoxY [Methylococcus geothermalis]
MIGLVMLAIIGMGTLFVVHNARRSVAEEVRSSVNLALQLIDAGLEQAVAAGRSPVDWIAQLARLDRTRHLSLSIHQGERTIIDLPSSAAPAAGEEAPGWFAWAVAPEPLVAEKHLHQIGNPMIQIIIDANPADEIAEAWTEARGFLLLMLALAVTVYVVVHTTLGRAFNSVGVILEGLENLENGDYSRRLPEFYLPEFARISRAFNHTVCALEKTREENRALTQRSLAIQEEERRYLAQELHDELGQSLSAIKAIAASLRKPERDDKSTADAVGTIQSICDHLFAVLRTLMQRLRPLMLDELGLKASLEDMIENWRSRYSDIALDFRCDDGIDECVGDSRIHIFRIVQESLTNVVRHSGARHLKIHLSLIETADDRPEALLLKVSDDGAGFDPSRAPAGLGLLGIRERVESLGGRFGLNTRPGAGVTLRINIPCGDKLP